MQELATACNQWSQHSESVHATGNFRDPAVRLLTRSARTVSSASEQEVHEFTSVYKSKLERDFAMTHPKIILRRK
jgi:hypothetical protein